MEFSINDFFDKCYLIRRKLGIWSHSTGFGHIHWRNPYIQFHWQFRITYSRVWLVKEEMYNNMNSYYKYTPIPKFTFQQRKYTYTAYQYWRKVSKIFHTFCLYLRLSAIMNLIFRTVRLENFMTSCRDKLYHHHASNKINSSSPPEVFLGKGVLKICIKFTGEHSCQSVISIKLLINFIEITLL